MTISNDTARAASGPHTAFITPPIFNDAGKCPMKLAPEGDQ